MAMTNLEALKAQCKLICNTCYVDEDVAKYSLLGAGIDEKEEATANNPDIIREAIIIVKGWVETSRTENGITASIDMDVLQNNIVYWCGKAGLDAEEFLDDTLTTIDNGTDLW